MKNKKLFAILTLVCFMFTLMPVAAFAESNATGEVSRGMYSTSNNRIQGAVMNANPKESVVLELYSDDAKIATTTLTNKGYFENAKTELTWSFCITDTSSSWNTVWEAYNPDSTMKPDKVVLYIDDEKVASNIVTLHKNNFDMVGEEAVWAELDGVYTWVAQIGEVKYESLPDAIEAAVNGDTITLLKDADTITINKNLTLNLIDVTVGNIVVAENIDLALIGNGTVNTLTATGTIGDITKAEDVGVTAPEGYEWNEDGKLVKESVDTPSTSTSSSGGGFSGSYNYPVNAADVDGAKVTFSDNNAVAGETVTITVIPDSGKQVDEVIVTDADGDVIPVTKTGDNTYTFTMPAGKVNVSVTTEAIDYDNKIVLQIGNQNVVVDGKASRNDVAPVIQGDRTLVPIRVIVEALGGEVDWNEATRTVTITIDGKVLTLVIDEMIPGFGQGATIMDSRTYVPIRYVAEYIGANVEWIAETQQIVILK